MSDTVTLRYEATVDAPEDKDLDELSEELEQWIAHATDSSVVKTMPGRGAIENWYTFAEDESDNLRERMIFLRDELKDDAKRLYSDGPFSEADIKADAARAIDIILEDEFDDHEIDEEIHSWVK